MANKMEIRQSEGHGSFAMPLALLKFPVQLVTIVLWEFNFPALQIVTKYISKFIC